MLKRKKGCYIIIIALCLLILLCPMALTASGDGRKSKDEGPITLRILYFQWAPGTALQKVGSRYAVETSNSPSKFIYRPPASSSE